jgi:phage shock protein E
VKKAPAKQTPPSASGFKKAIPWLLAGAAIAVIAILLFQPKAGGGFPKIGSTELQAAQKAGAQIVDVRTAGEFALAHIPGAVNVPVDTLQQSAASWDRSKAYVVYCASGARSAQAQDIMKGMGFKSVADLTGGIAQYTGPTEKGAASSSAGTVPTNGKPVFIEFYTPT